MLKGRDWNGNYFILKNLQLGAQSLKTEAKQQQELDKAKTGFVL